MKSNMNKGLHDGHLDLNPHYNKKKFERAKDLANHWTKLLGDKLKKRVEEKQRENFNKFINDGGRLTYKELRELNSVMKKDYIGVIFKESS